MIQSYLINFHTELSNCSTGEQTTNFRSWTERFTHQTRWRILCGRSGYHEIIYKFHGTGVALKELIYTWDSHVCARTHHSVALSHPCLRFESCLSYVIKLAKSFCQEIELALGHARRTLRGSSRVAHHWNQGPNVSAHHTCIPLVYKYISIYFLDFLDRCTVCIVLCRDVYSV